MAIHVMTNGPKGLLSAIYAAINKKEVETWTYDGDGDFIHVTPDKQWVGKAWLHPSVFDDSLVLNVVPPKTGGVSVSAYAVYHGRFIEMLLAHFDNQFANAVATALPTNADNVN